MPDSLNLSLWFPDFNGPAMLPHALAVLQQFPFSEIRPGITYVAAQPVSWSEPTILERRFSPGITPEESMVIAADLIHDDFAFVLEAYWDLWSPDDQGQWKLIPSQVKFIVQGEEFEDGTSQETGHIQIDFGLDSPFLQENVELTERPRTKSGQCCQAGRVHYEGGEEYAGKWSAPVVGIRRNLAQKLIARLQKVQ